jgi:dCMP deaminase
MARPSWSDYFMEIAHVASKRATCPRRSVGCVIVKDNHIISTGYNGSPPHIDHCDDVGCMIVSIDGRDSCQRATHAEQNAINTAARFGHSTQDAEIYVTAQPCLNCAKAIITAGIKKVYWAEGYPEPVSLEFFKAAGIEMVYLGV